MIYSTRCPGKINIGLRILGERRDGFHDLDTIFCQIALGDLLEFLPGDKRLTLAVDSHIDIGSPEDNLIIRAARAFEDLTGIPVTGTWRLRKNVPPAAGLGGGSSDAAGALRILQQVHGFPLENEDLFRCAAGIGSDVPFFLLGGMARGRGKGDRLERLAWPGDLFIVLVVYDTGLSTAVIYDRYRSGDRPEARNRMDLVAMIRGITEGECSTIENDLAPAAYALRPELESDIELLSRMNFSAAGMSGSGPTTYGITGSKDHAKSAYIELERMGRNAILTRFRPTVPGIVVKDA